MRMSIIVPALLATCLLAGCRQLERLSIVRPSAEQRGYTQVAPTYDVSGKKGHASADPILLLTAATGLLQQGRYDEAEHQARQALKLQPGSGDANTLLGAIAGARGKAAEAGAYYRAAAMAAPTNGVYANNYGGWLCSNGQPAASLEWFDRALADPAYPTPLGALVNAGTCAAKAAQPVRAEASWRQVLALDPGNLPALAGMAALEAGRGNYLEARAFAERWLAIAPADAAGLQLAADIEQKLGDNAAASRYLSRLQAIPPGSSTVPRTQ